MTPDSSQRPTQARTNSLAIVSVALSLFAILGYLLGIVLIISLAYRLPGPLAEAGMDLAALGSCILPPMGALAGLLALLRAKRSQDKLWGTPFAWVGFLLGAAVIVLDLLAIGFFAWALWNNPP